MIFVLDRENDNKLQNFVSFFMIPYQNSITN